MKNIAKSIFLKNLFLCILLFPALTFAEECGKISDKINFGSKGKEVQILQNFLVSEGFLRSDKPVVNIFGPATNRALLEYKKKNNLSQNVLLDNQILEHINLKLCKKIINPKLAIATNSQNLINNLQLKILSDKKDILPGEQVIFTARVTNVGTDTIENVLLGQKACQSDNLDMNVSFLFDGKSNFWDNMFYGSRCGGTRQNLYKTLKSGEFLEKNFIFN